LWKKLVCNLYPKGYFLFKCGDAGVCFFDGILSEVIVPRPISFVEREYYDKIAKYSRDFYNFLKQELALDENEKLDDELFIFLWKLKEMVNRVVYVSGEAILVCRELPESLLKFGDKVTKGIVATKKYINTLTSLKEFGKHEDFHVLLKVTSPLPEGFVSKGNVLKLWGSCDDIDVDCSSTAF